MIVFVSDPVDFDGITVGCVCTLAKCGCLSPGRLAFVDIGLSAAQEGFRPGRYLRLVSSAVRVASEVYAVVPDVFCNVQKTLIQFQTYAKILWRLGAKVVLVLQRFYSDLGAYKDVLDQADVVALPAKVHCDVQCSREPRLCAERIGRVLPLLRPRRVHLLGPSLRVLKILGGVLKDVYSFDTTAYRFAPSSVAQQRGRYMASNPQEATSWLVDWLKSINIVISRR